MYSPMRALSCVFLPLVAIMIASVKGDSNPDLIQVPGGALVPASSVYTIPENAYIFALGNETRVVDADGNVLHSIVSSSASSDSTVTPRDTALEPFNGWVTYAYWDNSNGPSIISAFSATWVVPPLPATDHGQTLYLFNCVEGPYILQPVLRYYAGSWTVASWWGPGANGAYFKSSDVDVSVGQTLTGVIALTGDSNSVYNYTSSFQGLTGSSIGTTSSIPYVWAAVTLETYATDPYGSDYPVGTTTWTNINTQLLSGATPSVTWTTQTNWPQGDLSTTVTTQGATKAVVVTHYPQPVELMKYCTDVQFGGSCETTYYPSAALVPVESVDGIECFANFTSPYAASISSAEGLTNGFTCFLYPCVFFFEILYLRFY